MKAVIYNKYGPPEVLQLVDIEKPTPKDDEILVKICAATVTSGDVRLRGSDFPTWAWLPARLMFGLFKPKKKILGHEFSGIVEAIGKDVTKYKVGDAILATPSLFSAGSYTEYICIPQVRKKGELGLKPENLSFGEAAALPIGGITALYLLNKGKLAKGQHVLIFGASGSVGSYAVQIAKAYGATVTGVSSGSNAEMVKSLGADHTLDYKKVDYAQLDQKFDIVFDAVGKTSKAKAKKVLKPGGSFVSITSLTHPAQEHLDELIQLVEAGKLKPYIDRSFPLSEMVAAHTYVDSGRKKGNVVIEVAVLESN